MSTIIEMLDRLADLTEHYTAIVNERNAKRDSLMPEEIKKEMQSVNEEYLPNLEMMEQMIDSLQGEIRNFTLELGKTFKGRKFMAVYNKPRVTWDTKVLDTMAVFIPEIENAKKVGSASVSIREI